MFILRKVYNSGSSAAEPTTMFTTPGTAYKYGTALKVVNGKVTNAEETDMPTYIAGETLKADEKRFMICYPILPDMLFEVPVQGNAASVKVGSKLIMYLNDGFADSLYTSTEDGVATVRDTRGATKNGDTVFVSFEN